MAGRGGVVAELGEGEADLVLQGFVPVVAGPARLLRGAGAFELVLRTAQQVERVPAGAGRRVRLGAHPGDPGQRAMGAVPTEGGGGGVGQRQRLAVVAELGRLHGHAA